MSCGNANQADKHVPLKYHVIDKLESVSPWGKAVGDVNNDGLTDIIVGGNRSQQLFWYQAPSWQKHLIAKGHRFSTDHHVVDLDRDGVADIVSLSKKALMWFKGPSWEKHTIAEITLHDVEAADIDNDGDIDLVARNQGAFGDGSMVYIFTQNGANGWQTAKITVPQGEGLALADLDQDGLVDIVVNGRWYRNLGESSETSNWQVHTYTTSWDWPHTFIAVADLDSDGFQDIILSPAETAGGHYHISWFESPGKKKIEQTWVEHIVVDNVETVHHYIGAQDLDNDGDVDLLTAQMHQGKDPDEVAIYLNIGNATQWRKEVVSEKGSHSMRIFDADNDGDYDFFGANWSGDVQAVEYWQNLSCDQKDKTWIRHVIDDSKPWRSIFVSAADINQDNLPDLISGGWWYQNPGKINAKWRRHVIGGELNNSAIVLDVDADGDMDVLGTMGKGARANGQLVLALNNKGKFASYRKMARSSGDFLQGVALMKQGDNASFLFSWHRAGNGIESLPLQGIESNGPMARISEFSQDEALSVGDIDADGDEDVLLGTHWLENQNGQWKLHQLHDTKEKPDRNKLADINGDGHLDAVVGYEAISRQGLVAWYEAVSGATKPWKEHPIAQITGPMSLDVADMDNDGDLDVVVGEHNLKHPDKARLLIYYNQQNNWTEQLVYQGDEHHDGAQTVDIDGDGDLDIVSIGWGHDKLVVYENRTKKCP